MASWSANLRPSCAATSNSFSPRAERLSSMYASSLARSLSIRGEPISSRSAEAAPARRAARVQRSRAEAMATPRSRHSGQGVPLSDAAQDWNGLADEQLGSRDVANVQDGRGKIAEPYSDTPFVAVPAIDL